MGPLFVQKMPDLKVLGFLAGCDIIHHLGRIVHLKLVEFPPAEIVDQMCNIAAEVRVARYFVQFCNLW
jgi:hypothetical protein